MLFVHTSLRMWNRHRMNGTRIGPLAASQTARPPGQTRMNWMRNAARQ